MSDQSTGASAPRLRQDGKPYRPQRTGRGTFQAGFSGNPGGSDGGRVRRALNLSTMRELQAAFNRGGAKAIDKVMRLQPALFLKMLVLLVPRELEVSHSGSVKAMSDEQIEAAIEAIEQLIARRAGDAAKVIDGEAVEALPAPGPPKRRRKRATVTQDATQTESDGEQP